MKMKLITLTIMSGLLLTGCDQVKDSVDIYIKQIFLEGAFKLPSIAISPVGKLTITEVLQKYMGIKIVLPHLTMTFGRDALSSIRKMIPYKHSSLIRTQSAKRCSTKYG